MSKVKKLNVISSYKEKSKQGLLLNKLEYGMYIGLLNELHCKLSNMVTLNSTGINKQ